MMLCRHAHIVRHVTTCTEYIIWHYSSLGTRRSGGVRMLYSHKDSPAMYMLWFVPCADTGKFESPNLAFQTKLTTVVCLQIQAYIKLPPLQLIVSFTPPSELFLTLATMEYYIIIIIVCICHVLSLAKHKWCTTRRQYPDPLIVYTTQTGHKVPVCVPAWIHDARSSLAKNLSE
jgi:hypothetical protein